MNFLLRSSASAIATASTSKAASSAIQKFNNNIRKAHTVRVILTADIPENNQYAGETHNVKAGYARNYLIPQKKALYANHANFIRVGMNQGDPELLQTETEEERREREMMESDEDFKAQEFLKYYLRNKTLKIWRNVDVVNVTGGDSSSAGGGGGGIKVPIYPGMVDHKAIREKLSKQLKIDLEPHEKIQILPDPISFSALEDDDTLMEELLKKMDPLGESDGDDGECKVQLKTLGDYLVKIHLKGDKAVGLKLSVLRR
jgi:ribosomal protein L9